MILRPDMLDKSDQCAHALVLCCVTTFALEQSCVDFQPGIIINDHKNMTQQGNVTSNTKSNTNSSTLCPYQSTGERNSSMI